MRSRHRSGGFQLGRTFVIVIGIHALMGVAVFWLAKTESGRQFAKVYDIKIFQPEAEEPDAPPPPEEAPPPPPPVEPVQEVQQAAAPVPSVQAAAPQVGTAVGGGVNWGGGRFVGGFGEGPLGTFHAAVTGRFRKAYHEPPAREEFGAATVVLDVSGTGAVTSYRLARSSGSSVNDEALLAAAAIVKQQGVMQPPEGKARRVSVHFVPY